MSEPAPHRRIADHRWPARTILTLRRLPGRDLWLLAISVVVYLALSSASSAINQIQQSRLASCQAQNLRHKRSVAKLNSDLARAELQASPAQRIQIESSRAFTLGLIDQLAPVQNCAAVVRRGPTH